jgi:hypothetical protein
VTATAIDQRLLTPLRVGGLTLPPTLLIGPDRLGQVGAANRSPGEAGLNHLADAVHSARTSHTGCCLRLIKGRTP